MIMGHFYYEAHSKRKCTIASGRTTYYTPQKSIQVALECCCADIADVIARLQHASGENTSADLTLTDGGAAGRPANRVSATPWRGAEEGTRPDASVVAACLADVIASKQPSLLPHCTACALLLVRRRTDQITSNQYVVWFQTESKRDREFRTQQRCV